MADILPPSIHETLTLPPWADAFWANVSPSDTSTCWLWTGAMSKNYGQFFNSTWGTGRVHRITYMWTHGPIPYGRVIDHLCRVTTCVNPAHLEAITDRENILRGIGSPAQNARVTHCKYGHPLTAANLYIPKLAIGERQCLICMRNRSRDQHYKRPSDSPDAAQCGSCGRVIHVTSRGVMHKHLSQPGEPCIGSGQPPAEVAS